MLLVGFDGIPVPGAFGALTPIFSNGESDRWFTFDGRSINVAELDRYVGYITPLTPIDVGDVSGSELIVYRHPHFYLLPLTKDWWEDASVKGNFRFRMMAREKALETLEENSRLHLEAAKFAYSCGAKVKAAILATHGLMTARYKSDIYDSLEFYRQEVRASPILHSVFQDILRDCKEFR